LGFSPAETDYLTDILTTHLFTLLSRVTRWQTHSLSQQQYDQQVAETLTPNVEKLQSIAAQLAPTVGNQDQYQALQLGIDKLVQPQSYQLTEEQLSQANERRLSRHRFR